MQLKNLNHLNLVSDINLCGYTLEFMAKILLRRMRKNNFIFQLNQFANMQEIITKYRLDIAAQQWLLTQKIRADIIEFVFNDLATRKVSEIKLYEVKVNRRDVVVPDVTSASYDFYNWVTQNKFATVDFFLIQIHSNWNFEWQIVSFSNVKSHLHIYTSNWKKNVKDRIYS